MPVGRRDALLEQAKRLGATESGLSVAVAFREDGSVSTSVVNAGVLDHPVSGETIVAFVARGRSKKLAYLRARPRASIVFRSGWEWVAVEGAVELAGPDDALAGIDAAEIPRLLRCVYAAAVGGPEEDWQPLDDEMAHERHTAVMVLPTRVYSNPE